MLKALIVSRLYAIADSFDNKKSGKKKSRVPTIAMYAVIFAIFIGLMVLCGYLYYGLCGMVEGTGDEDGVLGLAVAGAIALCVIGSTFATQSQIFEAKDNELVLSMPIPTRLIFLSRLIALFVINLLLESFVLLPCFIIYGVVIGYTPLGFLLMVAVYLLIPFLCMAVSVFIAWIISEISARVKNKTLVKTLMFVAFFVAYMAFAFSIGSGDAVYVDLSFPLFSWAGMAIAYGDGLCLLYFALCALVPFLVAFLILDKCFLRIITTKKSGAKTEYKGNKAKSNSIQLALIKKELWRFFSSAAYIMNTCIGSLMSVVVAVYAAINAGDVLAAFDAPGYAVPKGIIPVIICGACMFFCSMSYVSAPSVSLEDRNLWILHSAPIRPRDALLAKLACHMIICEPCSLISTLITCIAFELNVLVSLMVILTSLAAVAFTGYFGLILGLKFPKFDWQNENAVIKQSVPVIATMLCSVALFTGLWLLAFLTMEISEYFALCIMLLPILLLCGIMHIYLVSRGQRVFENLKK